MPVSVLDIDVNDSAFVRFQALFDKYRTALDKMPAAWNAVDKTIVEVTTTIDDAVDGADEFVDKIDDVNDKLDETVDKIDVAEKSIRKVGTSSQTVTVTSAQSYKNFAAMTSALMAQQEVLHRNLGEQLKMNSAVVKTNDQTDRLERKTKSVAAHMRDAVGSLVKWSTITTLASGLLGAGSLFGLDRLGSAAGAARRSAQGLGLSSSEQQAFGLNFNRISDPDATLQRLQEAKLDPSKQWIFSSLGLNNFQNQNAAQLGAAAPLAAKRIFEEGGQNPAYAKARGLMEVYTLEDLQRLHAMSVQEIQDLQKHAALDEKQLKISDANLRIWQDFTRTMSVSGQKLENTFITGLAPLAPQIAHLSEAFSGAVDKILKSADLGKWIDDLAGWIKRAGDYLSGPKFGEDLAWAGRKIHEFADAVGMAVDWFESLFSGKTTEEKAKQQADPLYKSPFELWYEKTFPKAAKFGQDFGAPKMFEQPEGWRPGDPMVERPVTHHGVTGDPRMPPIPRALASLHDLEIEKNLPIGLLGSVYQAESSNGADLRESPAGAKGPFQFIDGTARDYGVTDPMDFGQSSRGAANYLRDLYRKYGTADKAAAAYNWGPGNLDKDLSAHPDDWQKYLPKETRDYIDKVNTRMTEIQRDVARESVGRAGQEYQVGVPGKGGSADVTININNNTGGSAVVTTNQAARQS